MPILETLGLLTKPIEAIGNVIAGGQKRRAQRDAIKGRIEQAKADGANEIRVSESEWDMVAVQTTETSWKDEYVTIIITLPIVMIFGGALQMAFFEKCIDGVCQPDDRLLRATIEAIHALVGIGVDMGWLMGIVVLAAVGIKGVRTGVRELMGR